MSALKVNENQADAISKRYQDGGTTACCQLCDAIVIQPQISVLRN